MIQLDLLASWIAVANFTLSGSQIQLVGHYTWIMDTATLVDSPVGRLIPITGVDGRTGEQYESVAHLPHPLPQSVELTPATWTIVAQTEADLARLDQAARHIPEPRLVLESTIRREAQSTSALEGTFAPFEDVLASDIDERAHLSVEIREILNYIVTADQAFRWIEERPITVGMLAVCRASWSRAPPASATTRDASGTGRSSSAPGARRSRRRGSCRLRREIS